MKFTCSVIVNKPLDEVAAHFENPDTMKACQEGFKRIEHLSGEKGQEGSTTKLIYDKFELQETIIKNDLPHEFMGRYEHEKMTNTMKVNFTPIDTYKTRYDSEIDYTRFKGFMINVMAKLFPGMFKKQVQKWMHTFKVYVENN